MSMSSERVLTKHLHGDWEYEKYDILWNMDEFKKANICLESVNQTSSWRAWTLNLLGEC